MGNVRNNKSMRILKHSRTSYNDMITLRKYNASKNIHIHKLVIDAFNGINESVLFINLQMMNMKLMLGVLKLLLMVMLPLTILAILMINSIKCLLVFFKSFRHFF